ncbi:MAG: DUF4373 domain-containing protein [Thermoguttaceae bacterium]|nr:DUF4373 domain-containing protein [Thermoguttaceae bacterium]
MTNQTRPEPIYPIRDLRTTKLRAKLGARGYGIYCLLLERLADLGSEYLRYDPQSLAWSLRTSEKTLESVVKDFDLFEFTEDAEFFRHREEPDQPKPPTPPTEQTQASPTEQTQASPTEQTQASPTERPQASPTGSPLESFEKSSVPNGDAGSLPLRAVARTNAPSAPRTNAPSAPCPATDTTTDRVLDPIMDPEIDLALGAAVEKCTSDQLIEVMSLVKEAREDVRKKRASARGDP